MKKLAEQSYKSVANTCILQVMLDREPSPVRSVAEGMKAAEQYRSKMNTSVREFK